MSTWFAWLLALFVDVVPVPRLAIFEPEEPAVKRQTVLNGDPLSIDETVAWLDDLFVVLTEHVECRVPMSWRGDVSTQEAEIQIFESVTELLGGRFDGTGVFFGYHVNVEAIQGLLKGPAGEPVAIEFACDVNLCTHTGPELIINGYWKGKPVMVNFTSMPPPDAEPTWLRKEDGSFAPKGNAHDD